MTKRAAVMLVAAACVLHAYPAARRLVRPLPGPSAFAPPPSVPWNADEPPVREEEFVGGEPSRLSVHVGSICELSDGALASVWYGGSREGAKDVCVYFSRRPAGGTWSAPQVVVSRESARRELGRHVRKVGNPVVFAEALSEGGEGGDRLWLVYVSIAVGGWSGSSLNVKTSDDGGVTWTRSERLTLSPFFNVSELVKGRPALLAASGHGPARDADGRGFAVPVYHENIGKFPEIVWLRRAPGGRLAWRKTRMAGGRSFIQPEVVPLDAADAVAFYRDCSSRKRIGTASSADGGGSWSAPGALDLPNPNSGLAAVRLPDGRILLAFNDSTAGRENLRLSISTDRGRSFTRIATLAEDKKGKEGKRSAGYSYPYMIVGRDGRVHVVYTWRREAIRHVTVNRAWIDARAKEAAK